MSHSLTELEIYVRANTAPPGCGYSVHPVEAMIDGGRLFRGEATLVESELEAREDHPEEYGELLGRQLFNGGIARAYQQARAGGKGVRIRLKLDADADERHLIRWERVFVPVAGTTEPVSTAFETPFCRYLPREDAEPEPARNGCFRLLVVVANPVSLSGGLAPVDVDLELADVARAFAGMVDRFQFQIAVLPGRTALKAETVSLLQASGCDIVPGPATLVNIGLAGQLANGIHFICHGKYDRLEKSGSLFLEKEDGGEHRVRDHELTRLATPRLQLVYLQACESAARNDRSGMVGLAARLVAARVPAVVGMQQPVEMDEARVLTRAFYQSLVKDGEVDAAVNAGRRAMWQMHREGWHIPAVYTSRADGRLWQADAFSRVLARQMESWEQTHGDMEAPLPLRATRVSGPAPDPTDAAQAQWAGRLQPQAVAISAEHLLAQDAFVVLNGPRGAGKSAILDMLAWNFAQAYRRDDSRVLPVRLTLADMDGHSDILQYVLDEWRAKNGYMAETTGELAGRELLLLVDGEDELVAAQRKAFLHRIGALRQRASVRLIVSVDELTVEDWMQARPASHGVHDGEPTLLRTQPMTRAQITRYLSDRQRTDIAERIQALRCWDLAAETWILRRMIRTSAGYANRAGLYRRIADEQFEHLRTSGLTRSCLEAALTAIAWEMHQRQTTTLSGPALYEILATARGGREIRLEDIKLTAMQTCRFLRPSGEDGVRFIFAGTQSYYAALHLFRSRHQERELEDVIARLGRLSYLRYWQETLVVLAGMMGPQFEPVLLKLLAGAVGHGTGEQVYLAARCYLECGESRRGFAVREWLLDLLVWRCHPKNDLPVSERRKATQWLSEMDLECPTPRRQRDQDRALRLLIDLCCAPVSRDWAGRKRFEFPSIRLEALNVLLAHPELVSAFLASRQHPLAELVAAVESLRHGSTTEMVNLIFRGDDRLAPLAVFALGMSGHAEAADILVRAFEDQSALGEKTRDGQVQWAVAEMLPRLDWRRTQALTRSYQQPDARVVYMIGRNGAGAATPEDRAYLRRCLQSEQLGTVGAALRALAMLHDGGTKQLCEQVAAGEWSKIRANGGLRLEKRPDRAAACSLRYAALEALRLIGDRESIDVLRRSWVDLPYPLNQLAQSVTEEIYWRMHAPHVAPAEPPEAPALIRPAVRATHA